MTVNLVFTDYYTSYLKIFQQALQKIIDYDIIIKYDYAL